MATYGRFHVKGTRKKVNIKKWIYLDEMLKITRQFDDFGWFFLTTFVILWVFLTQNEKYPKNTVWKKFLFFSNNLFQISYIQL